MPEVILHTFTDQSGKRRVLIVQRDNGAYGFEEEHWSDEPLEHCWIRQGQYPFSICDSEETALREAVGRIGWLAAECGT